jgi:hypothetical protein
MPALSLRRLVAPTGALLLAACGASAPTPDDTSGRVTSARGVTPVGTASAAAPVVVELYQSQGCSSCPPANANVNAIAARPDVLALSFGVTYWDKLGWADSFAKPAYTARQWDYARHAGRPQVATPQVIVNGGKAIVGSNAGQLDREIAAAGSPKGGPALSADAGSVRVAAGKGPASLVWLVRYDPAERQVAIRAGENGGRTLPHRNVVRELVRLGEWTGAAATYKLPAAAEQGLRTAVLVQRGLGGPITAARRV